ncbi:MAG TPA: HAMP domain-containing histidine kinase [Clostridiales bacterium]|nr:HAMP domain-containing histidine kinase [Clostridiales bacterium]
MNKGRAEELKRKQYLGRIYIFIPVLLFFGVITTIQFYILRDCLDYKSITVLHVVLILMFWFLIAVAYTLLTSNQIAHWYEKPMKLFAKATNQVANGDFSVYVEPIHSADRMDYMDYMFLDFNKMVEELGSIETLKADFVSNVSHEIKTPIAVIQSYAECLQGASVTEEERKEYAKIIVGNSKRLTNLISNILRLNKLENQKIQPEAAEYDLCRQLSGCVIQFEELWEQKSIEFEAEMEERALVYGDESLMELVWNNLLSNAIKFTEAGGKITLKQMSEPGSIVVSVSDTGCGMSEDTMKHIFDKFYQGDSSHSREGNGLGLALVLRVLQLHDCSISVDSTPGKGTTFSVTIPVSGISDSGKKGKKGNKGGYRYE